MELRIKEVILYTLIALLFPYLIMSFIVLDLGWILQDKNIIWRIVYVKLVLLVFVGILHLHLAIKDGTL